MSHNNDTYRNIEPRLSFRYKLNPTSSIKGAYTENYQYVHLALLSGSSLPSDLWVPSSSEIKPKFSNQYAIGYFKNLYNNMYEASVETYYKEMRNLIEYKEGVLPEDNTNTNNNILILMIIRILVLILRKTGFVTSAPGLLHYKSALSRNR